MWLKEMYLVEKLRYCYETSTMAHNKFALAMKRVKWDKVFEADGETYYIKDSLTVTVENIDPFKARWKPSFIIGDYSDEF